MLLSEHLTVPVCASIPPFAALNLQKDVRKKAPASDKLVEGIFKFALSQSAV